MIGLRQARGPRSTVVLIVLSCVAACSGASRGAREVSTKSTDAAVPSVADSTVAGPTTSANSADTIRVTISVGCPASVAGHSDPTSTSSSWITNPDPTGLSESFVPGRPMRVLICRYAALDAVTTLPDGRILKSGDLYSSTDLGPGPAAALADALNAITPSTIAHGCLVANTKARHTAIVFAVAGRADIDLWLKDWYGCPEVGNGARTSGQLVNGLGVQFINQLDSLTPPAPQRDWPSTP